MKTFHVILAFCLLAFMSSFAQTDDNLRLAGIVHVSGWTNAVVILEQTNGNSTTTQKILKKGEEWGDVSLVSIDSDREGATMKLKSHAQEHKLFLDNDSKAATTEKSPSIKLLSVDLPTVVDLYVILSQRSVLRHPGLPNHRVSLAADPKTAAGAVTILEHLFAESGIGVIPDGNKFVMLVPVALTNKIVPASEKVSTDGAEIPAFSCNFYNAPLPLLLQTYGDFINRRVVNVRALPVNTVSFMQRNSLSKGELRYALETLISWNGNQLVTNDDGSLKIERIP